MTQTFDDAALSRWIDGELDPAEAQALEAAALSDPRLAARLADLRRVRSAARAAFPVAADPRDSDLARLIRQAGARRPDGLAEIARRLGQTFAPRQAALWGGFAAAAFVGGLIVAPLIARPDGLVVGPDGALNDRALTRVLDTRLAAQGPDADGRGVGLTFRDGDGRWCRTFRSSQDGVSGLACRRDGTWRLQALAPASAPSGEVRQASADLPPVILAAVDAALAGEVADARVETAARDAGWR